MIGTHLLPTYNLSDNYTPIKTVYMSLLGTETFQSDMALQSSSYSLQINEQDKKNEHKKLVTLYGDCVFVRIMQKLFAALRWKETRIFFQYHIDLFLYLCDTKKHFVIVSVCMEIRHSYFLVNGKYSLRRHSRINGIIEDCQLLHVRFNVSEKVEIFLHRIIYIELRLSSFPVPIGLSSNESTS